MHMLYFPIACYLFTYYLFTYLFIYVKLIPYKQKFGNKQASKNQR